jgi:hypothetical protein
MVCALFVKPLKVRAGLVGFLVPSSAGRRETFFGHTLSSLVRANALGLSDLNHPAYRLANGLGPLQDQRAGGLFDLAVAFDQAAVCPASP